MSLTRSRDRRPAALGAAMAAGLLCAASAPGAALAAGAAAASPVISLDGDAPAPAEAAASLAAAAQRDAGPPAPARPVEPFLAPLTPEDADWAGRLVGDRASARFSLTMPPGAAAQALRIAMRSGIDVLPEASSLTVWVNGVALPAISPKAVDAVGVIDIPADALRAGRNSIRIDALHHHRIYCGVAASFALWTEIDLGQSGAVLPGFAPSADAEGFRLAMQRQFASNAPLEIRAAPGVSREAMLAAGAAAARAAGVSGSGLRFTSVWAPSDGGAAHARIVIAPGPRDAMDVRRGGDGALVLRLVLAGDAPEALAARLAEMLPPRGEPGAVALLEPGAAQDFGSLGAQTVALSGRFARRALRFRLPEDWLTLTTRPARLSLRYTAAEALPQGAQLTVRLNGAAIQLLPLDRVAQQGAAGPSRVDIDFQAQLMQAGANLLEFEAMVPGDPPDMPCAAPMGDVVTIDAASTLLAPASPRMTLPGMAEAVRALDGARLALIGEIDGFGGSGLARLAQMRPLAGAASPARLTIMSAADAAPPQPNALGLSRALIVAALSPPADRRAPDTQAAALPGDDPRLADGRAMLDAVLSWTEQLDERPQERGLTLEAWLERTHGVAMLLQPVADDPLGLWLVLAPGADLATVAVALDGARRSGRSPAGRVSVLGGDGAWRNWFDTGDGPTLREPLSLANARDAAGNYASWSPVAFTMGGVGAVWASALVGVALVRVTREAGKR